MDIQGIMTRSMQALNLSVADFWEMPFWLLVNMLNSLTPAKNEITRKQLIDMEKQRNRLKMEQAAHG